MEPSDHSMEQSGIAKAMTQPPDDMAQIPRELTMLRGAIASMHGKANDLIGRLAPALRDIPEDEVAKIGEVPTRFQVSTEYSRALNDMWEEISTIEHKLEKAYYRLEL